MTPPTGSRRIPDVDYLTRDYRGLREQLIQLVTRSGTPWTERSAADVGIMALEVLAYSLDHLAYAGDRVAAEGFLRTAHSRQSVRLHAALGDYLLDRGSTSHGFQHFSALDGVVAMPALYPVGPRLAPGQDPADRDVFETTEAATIDARHNRFSLRKSIGAGSTVLWLGGPQREPLDLWAIGLRKGMRLALVSRDRAELVVVAGVQSGALLLEHPCRSTFVTGGSDRAGYVLGNIVPVRRGRRTSWRLLGRGGATRGDLPLDVYFRRRIELVKALAARVERHRGEWTSRPEIAAAWHVAQRSAALAVCRLRTVSTEALTAPLEERLEGLLAEAADALRGALAQLGLAVPGELKASERVAVPRQRVNLPPDEPPVWLDEQTTLEVTTLVDGRVLAWTEVEDLLRSGPNDRHYVVEIAHDRDVGLRFGDGVHGAVPAPGAPIMARWVAGDPSLGDVGRNALTRALGPGTDRLAPEATRNPLPTEGARPAEPLERVADCLRLNLSAPAIPVTRGDYVQLLEQQAEVREAAVLAVVGRTIRVAVRLEDSAHVGTVLPELRCWCDATRLAGTCVRLSLARPLHVSVAASVRLHREAEPEAVRAGCKVALRALFGGDDGRGMGVARTRGEVLRALEAVSGVEWSDLHRFDRAGGRTDTVRDAIVPAADQVLRCLDEPEVEATGRVEILVVREFGLRLTLLYTDPDLTPPQTELEAALRATFSGPRSRPARDRWDALSRAALIGVFAEPPFSGPAHAVRLEHLIHGDRAVEHVLLAPGEVPTLRNLQLFPRHVEEIDR